MQQAGLKGQPPQPTLQDNTDSNVQELKNQIQAERQKECRQPCAEQSETRHSRLRRPRSGPSPGAEPPNGLLPPCSGQPCSQLQQGDTQMQPTPLQQQAQLIRRERSGERADNSRFVASNLVFSAPSSSRNNSKAQVTPAQSRRPAGKQ